MIPASGDPTVNTHQHTIKQVSLIHILFAEYAISQSHIPRQQCERKAQYHSVRPALAGVTRQPVSKFLVFDGKLLLPVLALHLS
ncbi:hypothetical protein D3C77_569230 [compost metagenome]